MDTTSSVESLVNSVIEYFIILHVAYIHHWFL